MSKLIKHRWTEYSFNTKICVKCGCIKQYVAEYFAINITQKGPLFWYFRSGQQLSGLPECKIIFHNDKM